MSLFTKPNTGAAVDRCGPRPLAFLSFSLSCPVFLPLRLITENTTHDQILLYIFLFIAGVATTTQMVALTAEVDHLTSKTRRKRSLGSSGGRARWRRRTACSTSLGLEVKCWGLWSLVCLMDVGGGSTMTCAFGIMSGAIDVVIALTDRTILQDLGLVGNV